MKKVLVQLKMIRNITGMDFTTGKSSIFCKIRAQDSNDARKVIAKIHKISGVNRTETFMSLEQLLKQKDGLLSSIRFNLYKYEIKFIFLFLSDYSNQITSDCNNGRFWYFIFIKRPFTCWVV